MGELVLALDVELLPMQSDEGELDPAVVAARCLEGETDDDAKDARVSCLELGPLLVVELGVVWMPRERLAAFLAILFQWTRTLALWRPPDGRGRAARRCLSASDQVGRLALIASRCRR